MAMPRRDSEPAHPPLRPADLFILLVLSEHDLHGYGIMKAVRELSAGAVRVEIGSLYRLIARMIDAGLVADADGVAVHDAGRLGQSDERRRDYRITTQGRRVLKGELARLKSVMSLAPARRLLDDRSKPR
jgi:DNA-binding PadR family transcriptional regulator